MNFYARQTQARQQTRWLVVLFLLAVVCVVAAVDFVVLTVLATMEEEMLTPPTLEWMQERSGVVVFTSLVVLAIVGLSSLFKSSTLSSGGGVVARSLGGVRIERSARDPLRRRLFNVVEEMAIASGVPVPEIYVLEHESAINAFAAGHLPANAAVAVTRGALENLNRAQLQGVIAHEFGHVLNGDMRLNTRLIGLLFGLLAIALIGRTILRFGPRSSRKGGAGLILLAALAVMIVGYIGLLFGRLIQAAVSRQRERLADASAVQFTREPQGLKGALVKIGSYEYGSKLDHVQTEGVAHMLFASGLSRFFSTHPPLVERIKALDPMFRESEFAKVKFEPELSANEAPAAPSDKPAAALDLSEVLGAVATAAAPAAIAGMVGNPGTNEIRIAHAIAQSLPPQFLSSLSSPGRALGVLLALVLDPSPEIRTRQLQALGERLGGKAVALTQDAAADVAQLKPFQRLPILGELMPELRKLPREDRRRILDALRRLILVDGKIAIFEFALGTLARVYLQDELTPTAAPSRLKLDQVGPELQILFSAIAHCGNADDTQARHAYEIGMHRLLPHRRPEYRSIPGWPAALDRALKCLDRLPPAGKEQVVEALVKTISHDDKLTLDEAELLRATCAAIHCPLPPLLSIGTG